MPKVFRICHEIVFLQTIPKKQYFSDKGNIPAAFYAKNLGFLLMT